MKKFFKEFAWILLFILMFLVLMIPGTLLTKSLIKTPSFVQLADEALCLFALLVVAWTVYRFRKHEPLKKIGFTRKAAGRDILIGFIVALLIYGTGFGISVLAGWIRIESVAAVAGSIIISFIFFIFVAFFEEILVRGLILGSLLKSTNRYLALAISSVIFSLGHFFNPDFSIVAFINIFLAGIILGSIYIFTKSLWFSISLHFFWNYFQNLLGYEVSGNSFDSVIKLSKPGNELFTGGDFGFEGSILCTILITIATAIILLSFIRKEKKAIIAEA
jgi:uncharacterized protein